MAMEGGEGGITGVSTGGGTIKKSRTGVSTVLDWPVPPSVVVYKPVLWMTRDTFWSGRTFAAKVTVPLTPAGTIPTFQVMVLVVLLYEPPELMLRVVSSSQSSRRSVMVSGELAAVPVLL